MCKQWGLPQCCAMLCASFRKADVVYMPGEPHGVSCKMGSGYAAVGRKHILNKTLYGGKLAYYTGGCHDSECTLRHSFEPRFMSFRVPIHCYSQVCLFRSQVCLFCPESPSSQSLCLDVLGILRCTCSVIAGHVLIFMIHSRSDIHDTFTF